MYTVFVTGGIASGKSTVCARLRERGARVVSLDAIGHEILDEPLVRRAVAERFGADVFVCPQVIPTDLWPFDEGSRDPFEDAEVDRALLAERAFETPAATADLNAITHPRIMERLGELLCEPSCCMGERGRVTVVEVPLIEAAGDPHALADELVAVTCPFELRRARALGRGMAEVDFVERDARQISDERRAALADTVLPNGGDAAALLAAVDAWWDAREAAGWKPAAPAPISRPPQGPKSPAIAVVGRHNSGKTTLVTAVIAQLVARGVDVGSVKHHGHVGFDVDVPGKDSWRHREAGSSEVAICSPDRFALIRELDEQLEAAQIVEMMRPHDVVIVEGYRSSGLPSIEVMRAANERDRIAADEFVRAVRAGTYLAWNPAALGADADRMPDERTVGVASDIPEVLAAACSAGLAAFDLNEPAQVADYVERTLLRRDRRRND